MSELAQKAADVVIEEIAQSDQAFRDKLRVLMADHCGGGDSKHGLFTFAAFGELLWFAAEIIAAMPPGHRAFLTTVAPQILRHWVDHAAERRQSESLPEAEIIPPAVVH